MMLKNNKSKHSSVGSSKSSKQDYSRDYFATPPKAIDYLFELEDFTDKPIWECSCGGGHLSERMKEWLCDVVSSDKYNHGYGITGVDFLKQDTKPKWDGHIITNPPYKLFTEFINKALDISTGKVAMFCRLTSLSGVKRYDELYSHTPPSRIYVFNSRLSVALNGDFTKKHNSMIDFAWLIWESEDKYSSQDTKVRWINCKK